MVDRSERHQTIRQGILDDLKGRNVSPVSTTMTGSMPHNAKITIMMSSDRYHPRLVSEFWWVSWGDVSGNDSRRVIPLWRLWHHLLHRSWHSRYLLCKSTEHRVPYIFESASNIGTMWLCTGLGRAGQRDRTGQDRTWVPPITGRARYSDSKG